MQTDNFKKSYFIPKGPVEAEYQIKRNRFICYVEHCSNRMEAQEFIEMIKSAHPSARHHCWAYIAGNPHSTTDVGCTDDGEPSGTAGKPILSVLQYSGIGEIAAIVVRYTPGVKLGTGGLMRAYQSSVQIALDELETIEKVDLTTVKVQYPYNCEEAVRYFVEKNPIQVVATEYLNNIRVELSLPRDKRSELLDTLQDKLNGQLIINGE